MCLGFGGSKYFGSSVIYSLQLCIEMTKSSLLQMSKQLFDLYLSMWTQRKQSICTELFLLSALPGRSLGLNLYPSLRCLGPVSCSSAQNCKS